MRKDHAKNIRRASELAQHPEGSKTTNQMQKLKTCWKQRKRILGMGIKTQCTASKLWIAIFKFSLGRCFGCPSSWSGWSWLQWPAGWIDSVKSQSQRFGKQLDLGMAGHLYCGLFLGPMGSQRGSPCTLAAFPKRNRFNMIQPRDSQPKRQKPMDFLWKVSIYLGRGLELKALYGALTWLRAGAVQGILVRSFNGNLGWWSTQNESFNEFCKGLWETMRVPNRIQGGSLSDIR